MNRFFKLLLLTGLCITNASDTIVSSYPQDRSAIIKEDSRARDTLSRFKLIDGGSLFDDVLSPPLPELGLLKTPKSYKEFRAIQNNSINGRKELTRAGTSVRSQNRKQQTHERHEMVLWFLSGFLKTIYAAEYGEPAAINSIRQGFRLGDTRFPKKIQRGEWYAMLAYGQKLPPEQVEKAPIHQRWKALEEELKRREEETNLEAKKPRTTPEQNKSRRSSSTDLSYTTDEDQTYPDIASSGIRHRIQPSHGEEKAPLLGEYK